MAGERTNNAWNLETFLNSLIVELDKARNTLAIKALNKPLTYSVRDMSLDLQLFPEFDGKHVRFTTAKAGETGASKITVQLSSITDRQIRETSKLPTSSDDDVSLDTLTDLDEKTRSNLQKIGVSSVSDLQRVEDKNVDLQQALDGQVDYGKLAAQVARIKRGRQSPQVSGLSLDQTAHEPTLLIAGTNLSLSRGVRPEVVINRQKRPVRDFSETHIAVALGDLPLTPQNDVLVGLDPHTVIRLSFNH